MAVTDQTPIGGGVGNGVTTVFPFVYYIGDEADLVVQRDGVNATLNVDYVVLGAGNPSGGQIVFVTAPANGVKVTHFRDTALTRSTDYQDGGDLSASTLNLDFDRTWLALQEIFSGGKGTPTSLRVPAGEVVDALPKASERADMALAFDSTGRPIAVVPVSGSAADVLIQLASSSDVSKGDALIGVKQPLTGAVARTQHDKNLDVVSVTDFMSAAQVEDAYAGAAALDCAAAINAALAASKHVIVPAGLRPLIASTVVVPSATRLEFLGGLGNTLNQYPASYFIKKSTMTTPAVTVAERGWVSGGGVVCQPGNTGDGIQLIGNSAKVENFLSHGAGNDGVRVGTNAGGNFNSFELTHVVSQYNGRHGIYVHDGKVGTGVGSDANAATIKDCFTHHNTGDGIHLGFAFWNTILNHLSEVNTGWGIYLSGANDGSGVPECRYTTVIGGDFNEGNVAGQMFDQSYFSTWINPDPANVPTTAVGALSGSGQRNVITSQGSTMLAGCITKTYNSPTYAHYFDDGTGSNMSYPQVMKKVTGGGNGQGMGVQYQVSTGAGYNATGQYRHLQYSVNNWGYAFDGYKAGVIFPLLAIDPTSGTYPGADNTFSCGAVASRWSVIHAATGAINTSDERDKTPIRPINERERAVALAIKAKLGAFKFLDAIEKKGDGARWHFGVGAQTVAAAFHAEGLDPGAYGLFCYDEWEARPAQYSDDGQLLRAERPAGSRYGIRYDELAMFILAAM